MEWLLWIGLIVLVVVIFALGYVVYRGWKMIKRAEYEREGQIAADKFIADYVAYLNDYYDAELDLNKVKEDIREEYTLPNRD